MNLVPINGVINSLAGTHAAQSRGDSERNAQEAAAQHLGVQLTAGAEQVQGESATQERDADGRLPYQRPGPRRDGDPAQPNEPQSSAASPELLVKDPSGVVGGELDLIG